MTNYTATRVTPEQAYERYLLIKQGKENQLYSAATMREIKRAHPNDWKAIVAMKEWELPGGGHSFERHVIRPALKGGPIAAIGIVAPPLAPVAYGLAAGVAVHTATGGRAPVSFGVDHRGNMAAGYGPGSMDYQLTNQRRAQVRQTNQIRDRFENGPYMPLPRNRNHPYWKELEETLPQKVKLAKDLQLLLKPVNTYNSWNHKSYIYGTCKYLDNPLNIIKNAYNMKVDTTKYWENRNYFSNLYKSMTSAGISHSDILAVYGNPYLGMLTKWGTLNYQRQQSILKDYPETDRIAGRINEAKQALTLELANADYDTKQFIQDVVIVGLSVWAEKQFKLPQTLMAPVYATRMERTLAYIQPKYEKIAYKLSDKAGKLYKKAEDFFRKKTNNGLKKATGTAEKRTIPTHDKQREFIEQKVKSGEWKRVRGRNMYENKKGQRFVPTKEKFEIEVGEKKDGVWQHIGIMRAEGNGVGEILKQYAKGKKGGHYFK